MLNCDKCNHFFTRTKHLNKHIENNSCRKKNHSCRYCIKTFTTINSMYRHMKHSCKVKKQEDEKDN